MKLLQQSPRMGLHESKISIYVTSAKFWFSPRYENMEFLFSNLLICFSSFCITNEVLIFNGYFHLIQYDNHIFSKLQGFSLYNLNCRIQIQNLFSPTGVRKHSQKLYLECNCKHLYIYAVKPCSFINALNYYPPFIH